MCIRAETKKPEVIILSDIWGHRKNRWINAYAHFLSGRFDLIYVDSTILANIDHSVLEKEKLHQSFVDGGIVRAVANLGKLSTNPERILAFSIGGSIAWQYAMENPQVRHLIAISSTRLRYEKAKPSCKIRLTRIMHWIFVVKGQSAIITSAPLLF